MQNTLRISLQFGVQRDLDIIKAWQSSFKDGNKGLLYNNSAAFETNNFNPLFSV